MAIATGSVFSHTDALVKTWKFSAATAKGTLVVQNGVVGVTLTDTKGLPDETNSKGYGPYKITFPRGAGVGNDQAAAIGDFAAGVALDGTWEFEEVVSSGSTPVPTSTDQGTPVFLTSGGALTLASSGNTRVGIVNYPATYAKVAGKLPIAIGL